LALFLFLLLLTRFPFFTVLRLLARFEARLLALLFTLTDLRLRDDIV
jgi:hypothetical protein